MTYGVAVLVDKTSCERSSTRGRSDATFLLGLLRSLAGTSAGVRFEDRGEQALKGVGEPVRVWAVHSDHSPLSRARETSVRRRRRGRR